RGRRAGDRTAATHVRRRADGRAAGLRGVGGRDRDRRARRLGGAATGAGGGGAGGSGPGWDEAGDETLAIAELRQMCLCRAAPGPAYCDVGAGSGPLGRRPKQVMACRKNRNSRHISSTAATTSTTTRPAVRKGCVAASQERNTAIESSTKLSVQLLTGSGLTLAAARAVALAPCEVSATVPASSAAPIFHSSGTPPAKALYDRKAAAGGRMKVWTASQTLSTYGILSATNSMTNSARASPSTTGCDSTCSEAGR